MKLRLLRPGDELRSDDTLVARGGRLEGDVLKEDARQYASIYGTYGISVFAERGTSIDELAQQPPLVRFEVVTLLTVGALKSAGLRLEPTGRNPHHFTVAWDDLDAGIERLLGCEYEVWRNPYHEE